ncbi:MAG: excisionase family DNA-binding protein [Candidatus Eremiobacteraeota bacterium]|nr:excisionase family DNA-binding protein [Candidatus Eremiobacteraeota bacterium]MBC5826575.1 excisionase family DNA-binding protein [Candidatus Eremiobacteraeota bacterium]
MPKAVGDDGLWRVSQAAEFLELSRSKIYLLIQNGELRAVKIGRSMRLPVKNVKAFLDKLPALGE